MRKDNRSAPVDKVWHVPAWAWVPISIAVAAEATVNAMRAYGLGAHLEDFTVTASGHRISVAGVVLVLAAIAVALAQSRAAWVAFYPGATARQRVVGIALSALLVSLSVSAMSATLLEAQRAKAAGETGERGRYDRAQSAYDAAATELETLAGQRATELVAADLNAAPVSRTVFARTNHCTDVTRDDSYQACKPILDLRQENGRALRKRELEKALPNLKAALDALPRPAEASVAEDHATDVWGWLMGLAVVLVATFGSVVFAVPTPSGPKKLIRPDAGPGRFGPPTMEVVDLKLAVLAHVQQELTEGRKVPSNVALVSLFGAKKSTMSDWLSEFERSGLIPVRRMVGRCKEISQPRRRDF